MLLESEEGGGERETWIGCLLYTPRPGIEPPNFWCTDYYRLSPPARAANRIFKSCDMKMKLAGELAAFVMKHHCYLKALPRDDLSWFRLRYLVGSFLQTNEVSRHFTVNNRRGWGAVRKLELWRENREFGRLPPATVKLTASQYLETFVMRLMVMWTDVILGFGFFFWYCIMTYVQLGKVCMIQMSTWPGGEATKLHRIKDPFQREKQNNGFFFNATEHKMCVISDFTLQQTLNKLSFIGFCNTVTENCL